jgi:hypothetical protein
MDGQNFDIAPLLLLPNTRGQIEEGAATVEFDQRVVRLLWRSWWWFWFNFQKIFESSKDIW